MSRKINSVRALCEMIWGLELKAGFVTKDSDGVLFWPMIRMKLYYDLAQEFNVFDNPHPFVRDAMWKFKFLLGSIDQIFKGFFKVGSLLKADMLIVEHARTKKIGKNLKVDVYSYYYASKKILEGKKILVLSKTLNGKLEKNDGFDRLGIDVIELTKSFLSILLSYCPAFLTGLSNEFIGLLNEAVDIDSTKLKKTRKMFLRAYIEFHLSYVFYRLLFCFALKAKSLVIVNGYASAAGMIVAAKKSGLKVVELQHGVITKYHIGYSYPYGLVNKEAIPDELLVWSSFWRKQVKEVWPGKIGVFRNQYLEINKKNHLGVKRNKNEVVIISQGAISEDISRAIRMNSCHFNKYKVFYKLHPSEYDSWRGNKYLLELADKDNFEILANVDLYKYFWRCEYQIGVFSTAIFEGIEMGCKPVLLDLAGSEYMECLQDEAISFKEFCYL